MMRTTTQRPALTLIELVVVLVVLVALAGIVVPMLPSMVSRSHGAAGATNIAEVAKAVQTYEALNFQYPDNWDAIVKADGSDPTIASTEYFNTGTEMVATDLGAAGLDTLNSAGITTVWHSVDDPVHATFTPYAATATTLTATSKVITLTAAGKLILNLDPTGTYVVLGLGSKSSMIGKGIVEAPVHFPESATEDPSQYYGRFGVVFKVAGPSVSRALPVAVVAFHDHGLATAGEHMAEYYNSTNNK